MELHSKKTFSTPTNCPKLSRNIYAFHGHAPRYEHSPCPPRTMHDATPSCSIKSANGSHIVIQIGVHINTPYPNPEYTIMHTVEHKYSLAIYPIKVHNRLTTS